MPARRWLSRNREPSAALSRADGSAQAISRETLVVGSLTSEVSPKVRRNLAQSQSRAIAYDPLDEIDQ